MPKLTKVSMDLFYCYKNVKLDGLISLDMINKFIR